MTTVAGASRYLNSSTLANAKGISPYTASLLDGGMGAQSLLDSGRRINRSGIGISANSRALTEQFLSRQSQVNAMFSLGVGASLSVEGLLTKIKALRSTLPLSQIDPSLLEVENADDGAVSPSETGQTVDEEA